MNGKKILLVDDDENLVNTLQSILQREGFTVDTAKSGREAIEKAERTRFHLIILEIILPDISGDEVTRILRNSYDRLPIVFITSYSNFQDSIDALDLGVHEILLKPISPVEILRIAQEVLIPP